MRKIHCYFYVGLFFCSLLGRNGASSESCCDQVATVKEILAQHIQEINIMQTAMEKVSSACAQTFKTQIDKINQATQAKMTATLKVIEQDRQIW